MPSPKNTKLITLRAAVILLAALLVGITAGALTFLSTHQPSAAVVAGGAAFAGATLWMDKVVT